EALLSAFRPTSEIARLNARASVEPVQVSPEVFSLLLRARTLWEDCDGAFDITVGPLMLCWGFREASGRLPAEAEIEAARSMVGFRHVDFDEARRTVRFRRAGLALDLGAVGKGYAIDQAAQLLLENGVRSALTAVEIPRGLPGPLAGLLSTVDLCDNALAVSSVAEKSFAAEGKTYGHVMDPRTGQPAEWAVMSAVVVPGATEADVWSTALMVLGRPGLEKLRQAESGARGLVVGTDGEVASVGFDFVPCTTK
ncbi:MAG: FAD:protein FMN transferase, partial [Verrucomicrobia bacterium]|nr:FAD:protein FMN transferase [Verrucomicrobiota bacterium]